MDAEELIAAGRLPLAGPVDGDQIVERIREGFQRRRRQASGYDPGR